MFLETDQQWPLNAWYQAAWSHEVEGEKPLARTLLNENVALFRDKDGKACAVEDRCCHRATPLSLGDVVEGGVQCGYHGMTFNGAGDCVFIPGQEKIPPYAKVRGFPIFERQEIVWIWMGDPALADPSELLVDFPWNDDHENWPHIHDMYEIECNYMLLIDNLMDLTHIPYIHRNTIGGGDQKGQVNATMEVTPKETGVHYIRWMESIMPPPTYVKGAGFKDGQLVDRWQEFEYVVPSTVVQWTGALEEGRGAKESREQEGGFNLRLYHGVTPRTESSCYYFWTPLNGYKPKDEEATKILHGEIAFTFNEDLDFLEQQQACMAETMDKGFVDIRHDSARLPARRAIERMIAKETGEVLAAE
ncbi:MAG: aromatic ring-hydroxylating dioxygenase subunit alpha [Rhodospirillaceae bacterium]|nr:aromatic ring-hydroxylating dioxygenase subunit alpha [Rhodospirillaceae bacterium]